jgi:Uri superfamily endonuclease
VGSRGEVRVSLIDVDRADYVRIGQCPDNDGGLIWRDMRQPMADAKRWNIDYYKGEFLLPSVSCERTYAMNRFRWAVAARFGLA